VRDGASVTVEGTVTVDRSLLDAGGRRTVIEDATGAVELYLAAPDTKVRLGARLRVTGTMGRAWGAPRLHATAVILLGSATPVVHDLRVAPGPASEWRLVRATGTITSLHRTGDRWVAELATTGATIPVIGLAGAGIPASMLGEGRRLTVTGVVRRPYPSASDRRFAIVPRRAADLDVGPVPAASPAATGSPGTGAGAGPGSASDTGSGAPAATGAAASTDAVPQVDLSDLATKAGSRVRAGGLVTALDPHGFSLDDGTAVATVVLEGDASDLAAILGPGDALDVVGDVELRGEPVLVVRDPGAILLLGGPDAGTASPDPADAASPGASGYLAGGLAAITLLTPPDAGGPDPVGYGVAVLVLTMLAALVAVLAHRRRDRQRVGARIRARLEAIATVHPGNAIAAAVAADPVPLSLGRAVDA